MNDLTTNEQTMTVKEVAEVLNVSVELVTKKIREIMPDKMKMGVTTFLNEKEVTALSLEIRKNPHLVQSYEVKTKLYKNLVIKQAYEFLNEEIEMLEAENKELKSTVKMLVHDFKKLYTTTEISKELNLKSAYELNNILKSKNIQYKLNNTWVLYSEFSDKNYTSLKESVLDSGKIVYDRLWTGIGRQFILDLVK